MRLPFKKKLDTLQVLPATGFCMMGKQRSCLPSITKCKIGFEQTKGFVRCSMCSEWSLELCKIWNRLDSYALGVVLCTSLPFFWIILLYFSSDVWEESFFFLSLISPCKRLERHFALNFNFFSLQSVATVGSSLKQNSLDSYIQQYSFAFVQTS